MRDDIAGDLRERLAAAPFYTWAGISLVHAADGEVELALDLEPHHLNVQGVAHGGMIATLADAAAGLAVRTTLEPGRRHVTVQLGVHFLVPATSGRIVARGKAVRVGAQIAYAEAEVVDERGRLIARASSTLAVTRER
jgi:uncharacterized protein (TIGR00369 family)